jgi:hypothetical protein
MLKSLPDHGGNRSIRGQVVSARPVWMHSESNLRNIIFTWVHNTNTYKKYHLFLPNVLDVLSTNAPGKPDVDLNDANFIS